MAKMPEVIECQMESIDKICRGYGLIYITPEVYLLSVLFGVNSMDKKLDTNIVKARKSLAEQIFIQAKDTDPLKVLPSQKLVCSEGLGRAIQLAFERNQLANIDKITCSMLIDGISCIEIQSLAKTIAQVLKSDEGLMDFVDRAEKEYKREKKKRLPSRLAGLIKEISNTAHSFPAPYRYFTGREQELQRILEIVWKCENRNALLVGEHGIGKTAIVYKIADLIRTESELVPQAMRNTKIFLLNAADLLAKGEYPFAEQKFSAILDYMESVSTEYPLLVIENLDTLFIRERDGAAWGDCLKKYLISNKAMIIATTTPKGLNQISMSDWTKEAFGTVTIGELSKEACYDIVTANKANYEMGHEVMYSDNVIKTIVDLSSKYIRDSFQPRKSLILMDEVGSIASLSHSKGYAIQKEDVMKALAKARNIPIDLLAANKNKKYMELSKNIKGNIFGQDDAVDKLTHKILMSKAGLLDKGKPIGSFLFVGPTGIGKTELAYELGRRLGMEIIRFDMSEYSERHTISNLIGTPAGYIGYEQGGLLTSAVMKSPSSIILFDEIEKADSAIYNMMLQVLDYGTLTDNHGNKADFKDTIIIMTSNCGARDMHKNGMGFAKESSYIDVSVAERAVSNTFPPEFIGRISDVIFFNALNDDMAKKIVHKEIGILKEKLMDKNVKFSVSHGVIQHLMNIGFSSEKGARDIKATVEKEISSKLVEPLLCEDFSSGGSIHMGYSKGNYTLKTTVS